MKYCNEMNQLGGAGPRPTERSRKAPFVRNVRSGCAFCFCQSDGLRINGGAKKRASERERPMGREEALESLKINNAYASPL